MIVHLPTCPNGCRDGPDPNNTDAFKGPAGEGWSPEGDAWYHENLLLPEAENEAHPLAQTMARTKAAESDLSSRNFRCRILAEDVEGDRYLIDVGFCPTSPEKSTDVHGAPEPPA